MYKSYRTSLLKNQYIPSIGQECCLLVSSFFNKKAIIRTPVNLVYSCISQTALLTNRVMRWTLLNGVANRVFML